jgi:hypothetical protein
MLTMISPIVMVFHTAMVVAELGPDGLNCVTWCGRKIDVKEAA